MKIKQLGRLCAAVILSLTSLLAINAPLVGATAQTCVWTGATDLNFATATNWSSCGGAAPLAGDIISLPMPTGSSVINLVNNLGHPLGGVISQTAATGSAAQYHIDTISLTAGASLAVAPTTTCNSTAAQVNYGTITAAGALSVNIDTAQIYNAALNVTGDLTLINRYGSGYLTAATGSSVAGQVIIASPYNFVTATCTSGGGGSGGQQSGASITGFTIHGITVDNGASVHLADSSFPIVLGGGSGTASPELYFAAAVDASYKPIATTYTVSSPISLMHDALLSADQYTTLNVTGAVTGSGFAIANDPYSAGIINFNPSSNNSKTASGTLVNPATTVTVSNDQSSTAFTAVPNETLVIDGKAGYINLSSGSTLKGNGQIAGLNSDQGSVVAPGHSPGCITSTSDIFLGGTYQVDIGGTVACTGYDQINVTGGVHLYGALQASPYNGFVPQVGQSYTIINNDAADVVDGTFTGIAEGGSYTNLGVTYTVTYKGGDGNDVVLTVTKVNAAALPKKPNTGLLLVAAHPMMSFATSIVAAGLLYGASRRMRTVRR